ncbi:BAG family molecular chaperone regulator 8 [Populus alba x Populus x berolinensis]|nr:BAG family molecular chaperone regulator 8 [Populus alba x Populus x berolinensis]
MASHHHCQNHVSVPTTFTTTTTPCCCYSHCSPQPHHHPTSPPPLSIDPLLQSLVSLLQQQQQQLQHHQSHIFSPCLDRPNSHTKNHHQKSKVHFQQEDDPQQTHFVLASLLQRINTLESSLHQFSASCTNNHNYPSHSLRDTAARVIQTHFRAFLVHRSRTLRQLKELAFIKSSLNSLKSSISTESHFDFKVASHKAKGLLLKLDSIQGGDPMIRDGKRSVTRDLVRFLEFVDGFAIKRHELSYKSARNVRALGNTNKARALNAKNGYGGCRDLTESQREIVDKLRKRVEKISGFSRACENDQEDVELEGFQQFVDDVDGELNRKVSVDGKRGVSLKQRVGHPRVKKTVSFAENGNSYRVISDTDESVLNGDGSSNDGSDYSDDHGEAVEIHFAETGDRKGFSKGAENDQEAHLEDGGSSQSSDSGYHLDKDGSSVFSAPVPVKMESRADLMKRKAVKTVT